ncbi:MAG: hypothetical protein AAB617_03225 [Patescibacteria group bacterium]
MDKSKKALTTFLVLAVVAVSLIAGVYIGKGQGTKQAEEKFMPLVDAIFPAPPAEIKGFGGKIKDVIGSSIKLEVYNPDDYLPHTDGTDRAKEIRTANVLNSTRIWLLDYNKIDARGNPQTVAMKLSELAVGNDVTVRSEANIKYLKEFDASEILLVKY